MTVIARSKRAADAAVRAALAGLVAAALLSPAARAASQSEAQELVDKARQTIEDFKADPDIPWFRDHLPDAKAVMIVPVLVKGGFILGGSGGHGALLWHDEASGAWSYPAFYFMGAVTFGLQLGGEAAEVVLMVMTDRGRRALLSTELKLGGDVSVAAGPVGAGAQAATVDVLAFSRAKGLFGGLTVEGSVIEPRDEWNAAYYGRPVRPEEILVRRGVANAQANPLRAAIARARGAPAATGEAPAAPAAQAYDLAAIQRGLAAKGYDPGPADGIMGPRTRAAIRRYQADAGFEVTGNPSRALQRSLTGGD